MIHFYVSPIVSHLKIKGKIFLDKEYYLCIVFIARAFTIALKFSVKFHKLHYFISVRKYKNISYFNFVLTFFEQYLISL